MFQIIAPAEDKLLLDPKSKVTREHENQTAEQIAQCT